MQRCYMADEIIKKCPCGTGNITRSRKVTSTPLLLHNSCSNLLTLTDDPLIDPILTRMECIYDLVAVGYGDGSHFTGSFYNNRVAYE